MAIQGIGPIASRALLASPLFVDAIWEAQSTGVRTQIRVMLHHSVSALDSVFNRPSTPTFSQCTHVGQIDRYDLLFVDGKKYLIGDRISFNGEMEKRALDPVYEREDV